MNCTECKEKLVEYIEGLLDQEQQQQLFSHLKGCDQCRTEFDQLTALGQRITADVENGQSTDLETVVFNRIMCEQNRKLKQADGTHHRLQIWRFLMKTPIKLTTAATILIGAFIFLTQGNGTSIALAAVAEKMEQMQNCVFEKTTTTYSDDAVTNKFDSQVYFKKGNLREDLYCGEQPIRQVYVDFSKGTVMDIDHKMKIFKEINLTQEDIELRGMVTPADFIDFVLSKGGYEKLGRKKVDGILADGFEFNDKRAMLSMDKDRIKNSTTRIWADIHTHLPVRLEFDAVTINNTKAHAVYYDPKWDVELEENFFEPKIPANYMTPEERGLIGVNLENWPTIRPEPNTAAEKAGIKDGDVVLKVNSNSIKNIKSVDDALKLLSGKAGEKVIFTVRRGEQIINIEVVREPLPLDNQN